MSNGCCWRLNYSKSSEIALFLNVIAHIFNIVVWTILTFPGIRHFLISLRHCSNYYTHDPNLHDPHFPQTHDNVLFPIFCLLSASASGPMVQQHTYDLSLRLSCPLSYIPMKKTSLSSSSEVISINHWQVSRWLKIQFVSLSVLICIFISLASFWMQT